MNGYGMNENGMAAEKRLIVFLDSGDTIIDEGTEVRDEHDIVVRADVIPGADEMVKTLKARGYTISLVADGYALSFQNMFRQHGIYDCFDAFITSEHVRASKPSPRMFKAAMGALDLEPADAGRIVMVGNNLSRDIRGANALGLTSVHLDWTPRYPRTPADESERPDYVIHEPLELLELVERLNAALFEETKA
ncbi:HAD family hydrolase [Paenibacillus sp. TRM 82003]|nr:HAD family hydrolase [Paenibacillus sp. TRM 82003]